MSDQPKTRQELYDLIRKTSRDEYILEEMIRLGFWDSDKQQPKLSEEMIRRRGELQRQLSGLLAKERKIKDPEKLLQEYRKKRMEESRKKQAENRDRREQERTKRAETWQLQQEKDIIYLGEGISHELNHTENDLSKLQTYTLPHFETAFDLAESIGISVKQLRFLGYHRRVSTFSHYRHFHMPKKSGGKRLIAAPMAPLKAAQHWILRHILEKIPVHAAANGFLNERSILSNAQVHTQQDVVINLDFKDFFPSISFNRVKGVFKSLGYSGKIATILTALCTEAEMDKVAMDGKNYYVAKSALKLPQGAPSSPMLTNILCYKLDKRLAGIAAHFGYNYTRYADDLSFSASGEAVDKLTQLLWCVRQVSKEEGFKLHPDKLRIMRKGRQQEVTGIIVNDELGIDRKKLRQFRALLHQIDQTGWDNKEWGNTSNIRAAVWGYANFIAMVKPEKGAKFLAEVRRLKEKYRSSNPQKTSPSISLEKEIQEAEADLTSSASEKKEKPAWKLW